MATQPYSPPHCNKVVTVVAEKIKPNDKRSAVATFPKSLRLLNAKEYSAVFDQAPIKASHPTILILARPNTQQNPKLGLIVAKKNVKHAVDRNRWKRLVRESFRIKQDNIPPIDAIVLARKGAEKLTNHELLEILNGLWKRVAKKAAKTPAAPLPSTSTSSRGNNEVKKQPLSS